MQISTKKDPIILKILLLGDSSVGKTTLRYKYVGKAFESNLLPTLGADFSLKFKNFKNYSIKFQIWDVGGQDNYSQVRKSFYGGAMGALILYSIENRTSFENVTNWVNEFLLHSGKQEKKVIIIGNKIDLRKIRNQNLINTEEGINLTEVLSKEKNIDFSFFETSALNGVNLESVFESICSYHLPD